VLPNIAIHLLLYRQRPATFAIAVNVIAAIASALTGKRKQLTVAPESLGDELAAASTSGGFEPAELVTQGRARGLSGVRAVGRGDVLGAAVGG
jgi:hypothetical protein